MIIYLEQCSCNDEKEKEKYTMTNGKHTEIRGKAYVLIDHEEFDKQITTAFDELVNELAL